MKAKKLFWALLSVLTVFSMNVALTSCDNGEPNNGDQPGFVDEEEDDDLIVENQPNLPLPGADKITICVQTPKPMCGYIAVPGSITNWDEGVATDKALTQVEGMQTWYAGTFDCEAGVTKFKLAGTDEDGVFKWPYQISEAELIQGDVTVPLTDDIVINSDNQVVYIKIISFQADPCSNLNEAGTATFNLTAVGFPEGTEFAIAGNFAEDAWNDKDPAAEHILSLQGDIYKATIEVPAVFQYKYLAKFPGGEWAYFGGANINMDSDLIADDTIEYVAKETPAN